MSKAVLVMDMTDVCMDCQFCRELDEGINACCELASNPNDSSLCRDIDDYCQEKPDWCPLKPMPEKTNDTFNGVYDSGYFDGWNACIDAIEGGHIE